MSKKGKKFSLGEIKAGSMAIKHQRDLAMPTIYEAFLEMLTNSDDAYEKLHGSLNYLGDVRIEYDRGGKKNPTIVRVKDKAVGMNFEEMKDKLMTYHKRTSTTSRNFFGRGLRDVTALGDVKVSSIKNGMFSEITMFKDLNVQASANNDQPNKEDIKYLGTKKHGTVIEVKIPVGSKPQYNPYIESIISTLPRHYALSRVLDSKKKTMNLEIVPDGKKPIKIIHTEPDGDLVYDEKLPIQKYNTSCRFRLFKLKNLIEENYTSSFKTTGISVFGKKTCFQKNFLDKNIDREPLAQRYYGYLECEHIDFLMEQWHDNEKNNRKHDPLNSSFILNPTRTEGIKSDHPFAIELFREPIKIIKNFINEDRKNSSNKNQKDEKLSKLVDEMVKDCADLLNDIERDETGGQGQGALGIQEWRAIPAGLRMLVGEEKKISVYTFGENLNKGKELELYIPDKYKKFIEVKQDIVQMVKTKNDPKKFAGVFNIIGKSEKNIEVSFRYNKQVKTQAKIIVDLEKNREFKNDIEFEKRTYNVIRDKNRSIKVFAKYPEIISENNLELKVSSNQLDNIKFKPSCVFKIIKGTNYAIGEVNIKGLKLESETNLEITNGTIQDVCLVTVVDKENKNKNPFKWDVDKHDLGPNRAAWDTVDSNLLKISSKHESIKKYLGSDIKPFPYSESALFRILLVEILAEKFAEKRVDLIAINNPIEYSDVTKYSQVHEILQQSNVYFEKAKNKFLDKLHKNWIKEDEIEKLNS